MGGGLVFSVYDHGQAIALEKERRKTISWAKFWIIRGAKSSYGPGTCIPTFDEYLQVARRNEPDELSVQQQNGENTKFEILW